MSDSDYIPAEDAVNVDFRNNKVSVRTRNGSSIAKKMARLRLLEEKINAKELTTVSVSNVKGDALARWYVFEW